MVYYAYIYYRKGYDIYSNVGLKFPYTTLTRETLEEYTKSKKQFKKAIFLIDEAYLFFDSRRSGSKLNRIFSYFMLQTSKRNVHLFVTAQFFHTLDKRFREHSHFQCHCVRMLKYKHRYIMLKSSVRLQNENINRLLYIKQVFFKNVGLSWDYQNATKKFYLQARKVFPLYDTTELLAIE